MNRFRMTAVTLGLLSACFVPSMRADENNKETRMTINGPLQVQNKLLAPGQYVFKLIQPDNAHSVVSIYSAEGARLEGIIMGWSAYRADGDDKNLFTISQPQGNQPATLKYWFYPGDNYGFEFSEKTPANESARAMKSKRKGQTSDATTKASPTHSD